MFVIVGLSQKSCRCCLAKKVSMHVVYTRTCRGHFCSRVSIPASGGVLRRIVKQAREQVAFPRSNLLLHFSGSRDCSCALSLSPNSIYCPLSFPLSADLLPPLISGGKKRKKVEKTGRRGAMGQ